MRIGVLWGENLPVSVRSISGILQMICRIISWISLMAHQEYCTVLAKSEVFIVLNFCIFLSCFSILVMSWIHDESVFVLYQMCQVKSSWAVFLVKWSCFSTGIIGPHEYSCKMVLFFNWGYRHEYGKTILTSFVLHL